MYDLLIQEMEKRKYLLEVNKINKYSTEFRIKKRNEVHVFYFRFSQYFCANHFTSENGLTFDEFEKEVFLLLINSMKNIHQNKPFLLSLERIIGEQTRDELKKSLHLIGYEHKENDKFIEKIASFISYDDFDDNFNNNLIYKDDYGKLKSFYFYIKEFHEQVEMLYESERLFVGTRKKEMIYRIYYEGFKGYLVLEVSGVGNVMRLEKENGEILDELLITTVEEIKKNLQVWFKSLKEKQRIKNLLNPPRYFLDNWIYYNAGGCDKEKTYESLKKLMNPFEIEEMFAYWDKKNVKANELGFDVEFFLYENRIYIFFPEQSEFFAIEKKENWKEELIKKVLQITQESMEERLKDIR